MANKYRGEVEVTLGLDEDAKAYTLVYDLNAITDMEQRTGVTLPQLIEIIGQESVESLRKLGVGFVRGALTSGLLRKQKGVTEAWVGANMDPGKVFSEYVTAIIKGVADAMGWGRKTEDSPAGEDKPAPA